MASQKNKKEHTLDYDDDVLSQVGEFGRWQKFLFLLMWIPSGASAMAVFIYEFIAFTPDHRCRVPACDADHTNVYDQGFLNFTTPSHGEGIWDKCEMYTTTSGYSWGPDSCMPGLFTQDTTNCGSGYVYDSSVFDSTAAIDFEMVCQDDWKKSFAQSLYMAGMLSGSFVFGFLADLVGRRFTMAFTSLLLATSGAACALLPSSSTIFPAFAACRFLAGMGHVGTFMMAFTLSLEYVGPSSRTLCGCLIEVPFALGGLIVGFLSWGGVRDWRTLQYICSIPCAGIALFYFIIPESPRWLLAKGKLHQLELDVVKTARVNHTEDPSWLFHKGDPTPEHKHEEVHVSENAGKATILDLFRPKTICIRTIAMFYNWMVTTLCYYGLTMTASSLSDNLFLNFTLLILVEIPANIFCIFVMDRCGRKPVLAFCQILAGVTCITAGLVSDITWLQVVLALAGKFGAAAAFTIVFVYTAEMFPTEIRSTAVGSSSTCARIGGILAPQVAYLALTWKPLPLLVMGGSAFIGGIVALICLPETLGQKLPESMEDALNLGKNLKKTDKKFCGLF